MFGWWSTSPPHFSNWVLSALNFLKPDKSPSEMGLGDFAWWLILPRWQASMAPLPVSAEGSACLAGAGHPFFFFSIMVLVILVFLISKVFAAATHHIPCRAGNRFLRPLLSAKLWGSRQTWAWRTGWGCRHGRIECGIQEIELLAEGALVNLVVSFIEKLLSL